MIRLVFLIFTICVRKPRASGDDPAVDPRAAGPMM